MLLPLSVAESFTLPFSFGTSPRMRALLLFRITDLQRRAPREFELKTGRVLWALSLSPQGLTRDEIVRFVFPQVENASAQYQASLAEATNKLIQRARARFRAHGIVIRFCRTTGRFVAEGQEGQEIPMAQQCLSGQIVPDESCARSL